MLSLQSFLRKGVSLGYVGRIKPKGPKGSRKWAETSRGGGCCRRQGAGGGCNGWILPAPIPPGTMCGPMVPAAVEAGCCVRVVSVEWFAAVLQIGGIGGQRGAGPANGWNWSALTPEVTL